MNPASTIRSLCIAILSLLPLVSLAEVLEDGTGAAAWTIYDATPAGAAIVSIVDDKRQDTVIEFQGDGRNNGYQLGGTNADNGFNLSGLPILNWKHRSTEAYTVYVRVDTELGWRYLYYNQSNADSLLHSNGTYIHHGLGSVTRDDNWHSISRNLVNDLHEAEPDNTLLAVQGILVRGNIRIDDLTLSDNLAPVADIASGDRTLNLGTQWVFDGTGSSDSDGDIAAWAWTDADGNLLGDAPTLTYSADTVGVFPLLLVVTDDGGLSASRQVVVTVIDATVPTVYEDAEDGTTDGWSVFDASPAGATIENVADDTAGEGQHVIELTGEAQQNGFMLGEYTAARGGWDNQSQNTVRWRMNVDTDYRVYLRVDTTEGWRYIYYDQRDRSYLGTGNYVHIGLGAATRDGTWQRIQRNLSEDLALAQPGNQLLAVQGFLVRGSGRFDDIEMLVLNDEPPVAQLSASPVSAMLPVSVAFDASESTDDLGIANYHFDFGDLDRTAIDSARPDVSFRYETAGEYVARVTVTDTNGSTDTAEVPLTVLPDTELPVVTLAGGPLSGPAPLVGVTFDATATDNHAIASWQWDFGDNTEPLTGTDLSSVQHDFAVAGSYTVTVTVTDPSDNAAAASVTVDVTAPDALPLAAFTITPGEGENTLTVTLDAAMSSDDLGIASYAWDYGDGTSGGGDTISHTYSTAGTYDITLTVTDTIGQTDSLTQSVTVTDPVLPDTPPVAVIDTSAVLGTAPLTVQLSSTGSTDDDAVASVSWDIGTGVLQGQGSLTDADIEVLFEAPGEYTVSLTVTDTADQVDTATQLIVVDTAEPPALAAEDAARLLAQASFGPTEEDIARVQALGIEGWIDEQMTLQGPPHLDYVMQFNNASKREPRHEIWWQDAVYGQDQLRQRVAFALSQVFVISDTGYTLGNSQYGITHYYDMLREQAFGNYRDLLEGVTLSPVMGIYLSMLQNAKGDELGNTRADENYAREVMQLFSIGLHELNPDGSQRLSNGKPIPAYTQAHVEAYARVFTGWNYKDADRWARPLSGNNLIDPMEPYPGYHDDGEKHLLGGVVSPAGASPEEDLRIALDSLFNHPNVGPFLARQLIIKLVTSNPTPGYIARVSAVFDDNGNGVRGDLGAMVRAILLDAEARNGHVTMPDTFGKLREPLLRISHVWRAFHVTPGTDSAHGELNTLSPQLNDLDIVTGQAPLKSPSVFNFFHPDFSPVGMLHTRQRMAPEAEIYTDNQILSTTTRINTHIQRHYASTPSTVDLRWSYIDLTTENALAADPPALLERLDLLLLSGAMSDGLRDALLDHLASLPDTETGRSQRARDAVSLIMASPEYLVQR